MRGGRMKIEPFYNPHDHKIITIDSDTMEDVVSDFSKYGITNNHYEIKYFYQCGYTLWLRSTESQIIAKLIYG